ncbi:MAG: hypothetical protein A2096_10690 [Spirochaetes bacterium GWF1_41_5]|nr:MAG: hypothetical protein A2096_10690 [Spirochaetes bacterium GWF1_41_5]
MAYPVLMPRQGQSVETCIITKWHKKKGESVKSGDLLFSYETDKAAFDEEAKNDGILLDAFFQENDEVPVLTNIAVIGRPGENCGEFRSAVSSRAAAEIKTDSASDDIKPVLSTEQIPAPVITGEVSSVSPRARKHAERTGVDYNSLAGTGPGGRVIERDIINALKNGTSLVTSSAQAAGPGGRLTVTDLQNTKNITEKKPPVEEKISNIRRVIAQRMHESISQTAQLTLHSSADAREILSMRSMLKQSDNELLKNITINDLVIFTAARTLPVFPDINAHFSGNTIKKFFNVHIGIAVDTEKGLLVPTLTYADQKTLPQISAEIRALVADARSGKINPDLLQGATFTITNLGSFGIEMFTPVLNPPQVAILGVNNISLKPVQNGNGTEFIPFIGLSLTFDHRAVDGAPAGRFLQKLAENIKKFPLLLV